MMRKSIAPVLLLLCISLVSNAGTRIPSWDTTHFYTKHSFDVLKYNLTVNIYPCLITPYPKSFSARQEVTLKADSIIDVIRLNAVSASLAIDSVGLAGTSFQHLNDTLSITLDRLYNPGEILSVVIWYRHKNVNDNAFYAAYGTAFTDSPPEGARKWMPCWDRPSDKAQWELRATVKSPAMLGSTGLPASEPLVSGDSITYHWKSDIPVATYLITFSAKINFLLHEKKWQRYYSLVPDSIPVMIYHKPGENITLIDTIIGPMTDFFASLFGEYPFEKIGFATLNTQFPWGGMENQGMVSLRPNGYTDEDLIAHEHSHQWFGDLITCGTWADIWLNEGFGTYCQNLWVEYSRGNDAYLQSMQDIANYYLNSNPGWPLYHPEWAIHTPSGNYLYNQAITYNKGACVLHQLRNITGDSLFFEALKRYATHPDLIYGNAFTEDFIAIVNEVTGQDLQWFFDQWVYGANHPVYSNTFQADSIGAGEWELTVIFSQTQENAGYFRMPVDLGISFTEGPDTVVSVFNQADGEAFSFSFDRKPLNVIFDPARKILLKRANTIYHVDDSGPGSIFSLDHCEPNPFVTGILVSYSVGSPEVVSFTLSDLHAKTIYQSSTGLQTPGKYNLTVDLPGLAAGVYLLRMEAGKFSQSRKIIKIN